MAGCWLKGLGWCCPSAWRGVLEAGGLGQGREDSGQAIQREAQAGESGLQGSRANTTWGWLREQPGEIKAPLALALGEGEPQEHIRS